MRNNALKILRALEKNKEMTLEQISFLIPNNFNDHRDYYVFAHLLKEDYISDFHLHYDEKPPEFKKEQLLARKYFAISKADFTAEYMGATYTVTGKTKFKDQPIALTGKGYILLEELRTKRNDRILTISSGIVIGIIVAILSAYL